MSKKKPRVSTHDPDYEALLNACRTGDLKAAYRLMRTGVDQNKPVPAPRGWSPLMVASYYGHLGMVKYLVRKGARLDLIEVDGWWTALDLAEHGKRDDVVKYLHSIKAPRGADVANPYRGGKLGGWGSEER